MAKLSLTQIKDFVRERIVEDISEDASETHRENLERIAYSLGRYGVNGGLYRDTLTGKLYAITKDNTNLYKYH